jgi:CBS domain containing-hemolysin-like protein
MIGTALVMIVVGVLLSAFFSGSETGLYRATRLRLLLDALSGNWIARGLLWLANHPSLFVSTTLIGNNLASNLVSLGVVVVAQAITSEEGHLAEFMGTLFMTPVLFVYGELVPKNLFLAAPNRLLRAVGVPLLGFTVLFAPVSVVVWGLDRLLQRLLKRSPEQVRSTLARREWGRLLEEGHEAGILHPTQRDLAQGLFTVGAQPVGRFATPPGHFPRARSTMTKQEILGLAHRYRVAFVPIEKADSQPDASKTDLRARRGTPEPREFIGYVRVIDLAVNDSPEVSPVLPLLKINDTATRLAAVMAMQSAQEEMALVVNAQGQTVGIVTADQLREPLFRAAQ